MKRSMTLAALFIFLATTIGAIPGFGSSPLDSEVATKYHSIQQDQSGTATEVIAPAPTDSSTLSMSSMEVHGALMRGNKAQLAVLIANNFRATMPNGVTLDRAQFLEAVVDTKLFYHASVAPARVNGNTATTKGWIAPMNGNRQERVRIRFTDTWEKQGEMWLLVATTIRKQRNPHHRKSVSGRAHATATPR